jgi:hypothetical protein
MAVSGGPILVQGGKVQRVASNKAGDRHPRTAFGWNGTHFFRAGGWAPADCQWA